MPIRSETSTRAVVVWWVGPPTAADIEEVVGLLQRVTRSAGAPPYYVCVVTDEARPPDAGGRAAFVGRVDEVMGLCEHFHVVLEASPFLNAIARGLIAAGALLPRFRSKVSLHDNLDGAMASVPLHLSGGTAFRERLRNSSPI